MEENRKGAKSMRKKILSMILALTMAIPSVSVVYGSEFSSGQEEAAVSVQMENETVFFDDEAAVEAAAVESDSNMVSENPQGGDYSGESW